jgi:hypothetical protein
VSTVGEGLGRCRQQLGSEFRIDNFDPPSFHISSLPLGLERDCFPVGVALLYRLNGQQVRLGGGSFARDIDRAVDYLPGSGSVEGLHGPYGRDRFFDFGVESGQDFREAGAIVINLLENKPEESKEPEEPEEKIGRRVYIEGGVAQIIEADGKTSPFYVVDPVNSGMSIQVGSKLKLPVIGDNTGDGKTVSAVMELEDVVSVLVLPPQQSREDLRARANSGSNDLAETLFSEISEVGGMAVDLLSRSRSARRNTAIKWAHQRDNSSADKLTLLEQSESLSAAWLLSIDKVVKLIGNNGQEDAVSLPYPDLITRELYHHERPRNLAGVNEQLSQATLRRAIGLTVAKLAMKPMITVDAEEGYSSYGEGVSAVTYRTEDNTLRLQVVRAQVKGDDDTFDEKIRAVRALGVVGLGPSALVGASGVVESN